MQFKLAALFCVAKCDMWADDLDATAIKSAKFLMTTSTQWAGTEREFWTTTEVVRKKLVSLAYKIIISQPPAPGNVVFVDDATGRAYMNYVVGTPLATWDYNWAVVENFDLAFSTYIEVCSRVCTETRETEVGSWFTAGIV
jgi:hypothetical protein